jgi:hypothetical protein
LGVAEIDPLAKLIYDESVRALDIQSKSLDELRSRTGVLIAATSVGSAFLGAEALKHHHATYSLNLAAFAIFGAVIVTCLLILWPTGWQFAYDATDLDSAYIVKREDPTQACRSMAEGHTNHRRANGTKLNYRFIAFQLACVGLAANIALWLLSVGVR